MFLQDMALDLIFQIQDQIATLTYDEMKDKLIGLCRPKLPRYKAEIEVNLVQQNEDETIDAYFLRKLRAIRHNLPDSSEEEKVHFLSLGLRRSFLKQIALESFDNVQDLQTRLQRLENSNDLLRKRDFMERSQALLSLDEKPSHNLPYISQANPLSLDSKVSQQAPQFLDYQNAIKPIQQNSQQINYPFPNHPMPIYQPRNSNPIPQNYQSPLGRSTDYQQPWYQPASNQNQNFQLPNAQKTIMQGISPRLQNFSPEAYIYNLLNPEDPMPTEFVARQNGRDPVVVDDLTHKLAELSLMVVKNNNNVTQKTYNKKRNDQGKKFYNKKYNNRDNNNRRRQHNEASDQQNKSGTVMVCSVCYKRGHTAHTCWHNKNKDNDQSGNE